MNMTVILHLVFYLAITTAIISKSHQCYLEYHKQVLSIPDCLNTGIEIETTSCGGNCYSTDFLVHDWRSESKPYRHQRNINCCSPNATISREIRLLCNDKRQRIIKYPLVIKCKCQSCPNDCIG